MFINLPKMNGIAAFKIIRNDAALQHIPVIALTASVMIAYPRNHSGAWNGCLHFETD